MPVVVPATVERRVRKKWSRRAKLMGYGLVAAYLVGILGWIWFFDGDAWIVCVVTGGATLGARYIRAGRYLEQADGDAVVDEQTRKLMSKYERQIRAEGETEIAGGSLSIPTTEGGEGALSEVDDRRGALGSPTPPK